MAASLDRVRGGDYLLLFGFCLLLFGYSMVGGRPLTMHEAVVPQSTREMVASGDWIVPTSGGRPWLERSPLPHWITAAICAPLGACGREWAVRLPAALMGTAVVLLVAGLAAWWFGRATGLVSGYVVATMFEFTSYAWLAESEIYLCLLVTAAIAVVASIETSGRPRGAGEPTGFLGARPWPVAVFFVIVAATNLTKGLLFGTLMVLAPVIGYLVADLWRTRDWTSVRRYVWLWGWMIYGALGAAWPYAVYRRYPDALELWRSDLLGRVNGTLRSLVEPMWYYLGTLSWEIAPWTLFAAIGLFLCVRDLRRAPDDARRFLVAWTVLPIVVLSLPPGKHHHYLLHGLAPWAICGALGVQWFWSTILDLRQRGSRWPPALFLLLLAGCAAAGVMFEWLGAGTAAGIGVTIALLACASALGLAVRRRRGALAMACAVGSITAVYLPYHSMLLPASDQTVEDTAFLRAIPPARDRREPLVANADLQSLDLFRNLFYLDPSAVTIPDLGYLDDERFAVPGVMVLTRARDRARLQEFGDVTLLLQSARTRRETGPGERMTLFRLRYRPDLVRRHHSWRVSPMQALFGVS